MTTEQSTKKTGFRRRLVGTVRSTAMDKTVVVEVVRRYVSAKYRKYVRARERYKAHDEVNECAVGDKVLIECATGGVGTLAVQLALRLLHPRVRRHEARRALQQVGAHLRLQRAPLLTMVLRW